MSTKFIIGTAFIAFILTLMALPIYISAMRQRKVGQEQREEGPQSHKAKSGTPTMGAIVFVPAVFIATLIGTGISRGSVSGMWLLLITFLGYAFIGFWDDFVKVREKRNLGLTAKQKLIGQLVIGILFYVVYHLNGYTDALNIPFTNIMVELPYVYGLFIIFWLVGFSNATNLTDGLDGLLAGLAIFSFGAFAIIAYHQHNLAVMYFCMAIIGGLLAFLIFNRNPAKVFMGDTGSLALGGSMAAVSILLKVEWLMLLIGLVYVIETVSVMMQVSYFKLTHGKRIFRMTPIHHHFELGGWSETKVVFVFWTAGLVCAVAAVLMEVL
ncbi:phospho-N-acetylmuramoyl-pentapeptide-transferase [Brochothrix campestris]|uniref:Phospho-N-acetylmuramoyl-pentapeptide-transferase n=1 Tax=Brochothrix campestris FSL F6-1037 TaxID=1265861 RepID=W7D8E9_9LIST|nr:phospho-N-acetylmuramoyl-pentapeptide-transferase [Brochothrix campestris]EUJ41738.1 phospho-N-acetylmuramoyl-pentapeptide-transferase [Brochothrix campestris FSL F6-1037]